jgi:hypothetical protein
MFKWFWKCSISKAVKPVIYTPYSDRRIVKRYDTNNNFVNDAYTEVFEEINNILNEQISLSPPPLTRQPAMDNRLIPPPLTRQMPINAPNLELI